MSSNVNMHKWHRMYRKGSPRLFRIVGNGFLLLNKRDAKMNAFYKVEGR